MSEWKWIDRCEREPKDHELVVVLYEDGSRGFIEWGRCLWALESATHWMPIPPPPPRTVTIEISEEAAKAYSLSSYGIDTYGEEVAKACRAALAKMEG